MDQELARKRPAQIVATTARVSADIKTLPRREVITRTFHQKQELVKEVHRLARRGEIGTTYRTTLDHGMWRAEVIRIREPGRRWGKPLAWLGGSLAGAVALLWLAALALQALAAVLPYVIGGMIVVVVLAVAAKIVAGGGISISQSVNIK
jgi:hypothetical protein